MIENELKKRVEKIRKDRTNLMKEVISLLKSDPIFLNTNDRLRNKFITWMVQNELVQNISINTKFKKKGKKKIRYEKYTNEYIILRNLVFYTDSIYYSKSDYRGLDKKCPYTQNKSFSIGELNGEIWIKYELILKLILKTIPLYQEFFYQAELQRLCDKKYTYICEKCGSKNEKCAVYCNMCGGKLHED